MKSIPHKNTVTINRHTFVYAVVTDCSPLICFCLAAMEVWSFVSFDANFRASLSRKISAPWSLLRPRTWVRREGGREGGREREEGRGRQLLKTYSSCLPALST